VNLRDGKLNGGSKKKSSKHFFEKKKNNPAKQAVSKKKNMTGGGIEQQWVKSLYIMSFILKASLRKVAPYISSQSLDKIKKTTNGESMLRNFAYYLCVPFDANPEFKDIEGKAQKVLRKVLERDTKFINDHVYKLGGDKAMLRTSYYSLMISLIKFPLQPDILDCINDVRFMSTQLVNLHSFLTSLSAVIIDNPSNPVSVYLKIRYNIKDKASSNRYLFGVQTAIVNKDNQSIGRNVPTHDTENLILTVHYNPKRYDVTKDVVNTATTLQLDLNEIDDRKKHLSYWKIDPEKPDDYIYSYEMGPFNKVFTTESSTTKMASAINELSNFFESSRNKCFIMGYGVSGSGKTSMLIYNITTKEEGILLHWLKTNSGKFDGKFTLDVKQFFKKNDTIIKDNDTEEYDDIITEQEGFGTILRTPQKNSYYNMNQIHDLQFTFKGKKFTCEKTSLINFDGLKTDNITDLQELLTYVVNDLNYRRTSVTSNNKDSSRSHVLLTLKFASKTLYVADYAGVENAFVCESFNELIALANQSSSNEDFVRAYNDILTTTDDKTNCEYANNANGTKYMIGEKLSVDVKVLRPEENRIIFGYTVLTLKLRIEGKTRPEEHKIAPDKRYVNCDNDDMMQNYYDHNAMNDTMKQTYALLGFDLDKDVTEMLEKDIQPYIKHVKNCIEDIEDAHRIAIGRDKYKNIPQRYKYNSAPSILKIMINETEKTERGLVMNRINGEPTMVTNNRVGCWKHFFDIFKNQTVDVFGITIDAGDSYTKVVIKDIKFKVEKPDIKEYTQISLAHVDYIARSIRTLLSVQKSCNCRKQEGMFINRTNKTTRDAINVITRMKMADQPYAVPILNNDCMEMFCDPFYGRCFDDYDVLNVVTDVENTIYSDIIGNYILKDTQTDEPTNINDIDFVVLGVFDNSSTQNKVMPQAYIDVEELIIEYNHLKRSELENTELYNESIQTYISIESTQYPESSDNQLILLRNYLSSVKVNKSSQNNAIDKYVKWVKYYVGQGITKDQYDIIGAKVSSFKTSPDSRRLLDIINYQTELNQVTPMGSLRYLDSIAKYNYGYKFQNDAKTKPPSFCSRSYLYDNKSLHGLFDRRTGI
jgi:hypothetical protein